MPRRRDAGSTDPGEASSPIEVLLDRGSGSLPVPEGDALRYQMDVDLANTNNSQTQLVLMTGVEKKVLEVGCATGYMTKVLRERGCAVTGLEVDPVAARQAARFAERMIVADIEAVDVDETFGSDRFNVVILGDVLEHLLDPATALMRLGRLLAPGGQVVASIPNVAHASVRLSLLANRFRYTSEGLLDRSHVRFFTREGVVSLLAGAGFTIEEWRETHLGPFDTEMGLRAEDFPSGLVEAVLDLPDALTYQFLVRARPVPEAEVIDVPVMEETRAAVAPFWSAHEGLLDLQGKAAFLEDSVLERDRDLAERNQRIAQLDVHLRQVQAALDEASQRFEREQRALAEELERITGSAGYRVARGVSTRLRRWLPRGTLRGRLLGWLRRVVYRMGRRRRRERLELEGGLSAADRLPTSPFVDLEEYRRWIERFEASPDQLEQQRTVARTLSYSPLMSVVVPTWNPSPAILRQTVEAVRAQTYGRWELCIADGGSGPDVQATLRELSDMDARVRVSLLPENRGISRNTNAALELAEGEFVAFLDQTDLVAPFALFAVAEALNRDPGLDVLYSDWDLLSEDGGIRFNPFFTPEWSPELLLSSNYMTHLSVVRRSLVSEAGGLRPEIDGAQDWDLLLRVTERTDRVKRLPAILYHWRTDEGSANLSLEAKPAVEAAQRRAVQEHLDRRGAAAEVVRDERRRLRVTWRIQAQPTVSIIIPTHHNRQMLERCLAGIARSTYPNTDVVVIETAGRTAEREDWYRGLTARYPCRVLWWDQPFNYSAVNNLGAGATTGEVLVFLNDDTEALEPRWLEDMVGWIQQERVGVVGPQLLDQRGHIQHGGVVVGMGGFAEHLFRGLDPGDWSLLGATDWYRNVTAVTGACLAISRAVYDEVGGWDEGFILCGSDVELCLRVRQAGYRVLVDPVARLRHVEGATRGSAVPYQDFCTSLWHYQGALYGGDPYFNPNLSTNHMIPRLREHREESATAVVARNVGRDLTPRAPGDDARDTSALIEASRVDGSDVDEIRRSHAAATGRREVRTVNWFIPDFENPFYGGIHTIFRFADHFQREHGVENRFVVVGTGPAEYIRSGLRVTFPELQDAPIILVPGDVDRRLADVPPADAAICTLWVTAYPMARWHGADRYFSFVQDFEPMFYPAGPLYALAEETYRMGFYGIANTPPLKQVYESYGGPAVSFSPSIDADVFHARRSPRKPEDPFTVFMYARPGHPRNCYELAVAALGRLKETMADRVRIVTAGSWADATTLPWLDHRGLLAYGETADLYRRCDVGLVLSVSKHPTYIPLQLMASGALVVANHNPANGWLLRDEENALLADPTAASLAGALERGLVDQDLRERLTAQAEADIRDRHADWASQIERVHEFICDPEPG